MCDDQFLGRLVLEFGRKRRILECFTSTLSVHAAMGRQQGRWFCRSAHQELLMPAAMRHELSEEIRK